MYCNDKGMAHKNLIKSEICPYHVTSRSNNKDWFELEMDVLWVIFSEQLLAINLAYRAKVHTFVLMNNHYHMLISTPEKTLIKL
jgi:putative transposase